MLLLKPSVEILHINTGALALIETAGRTCYKSEGKIGCTVSQSQAMCVSDDCSTCPFHSSTDFAKMILKRGHESVIEHVSATVRFICDRGVSHEIVRHRLASYSQESTRYCDYKAGHVAFVIPSWIEVKPGEYAGDALADLLIDHGDNDNAKAWLIAMDTCEAMYKEVRAMGWKPEQARSVLPNSLKTEIVMTANLREWRHFFRLRTAAAAHPQMREVACPLLEKFRQAIPVLFDDVGTTESAV